MLGPISGECGTTSNLYPYTDENYHGNGKGQL